MKNNCYENLAAGLIMNNIAQWKLDSMVFSVITNNVNYISSARSLVAKFIQTRGHNIVYSVLKIFNFDCFRVSFFFRIILTFSFLFTGFFPVKMTWYKPYLSQRSVSLPVSSHAPQRYVFFGYGKIVLHEFQSRVKALQPLTVNVCITLFFLVAIKQTSVSNHVFRT